MAEADIINTAELFGRVIDDFEEAAKEAEAEIAEEESQEESPQEDSEENSAENSDNSEEESDDEAEEAEEEEDEEAEEDDESSEKEIDKTDSGDIIDEKAAIHEIVVDGVSSRVSLEDLKRDAQKVKAADRRFKEASQKEKGVQAFYAALIDNPWEAVVDEITDRYCQGNRIEARARVVESALEWLAPEREASKIQDEKERKLYERERELELRQQEAERKERAKKTRQEQEADEEFDRSLRLELKKAFEEHSLPEDRAAIWQRTGKLLQEFSDELPQNLQGNVDAMRQEIVKNARHIVAQVAKERKETKDALKSTLSVDELAEIYPELQEALKKTKIDNVKKKRSSKKKGNAEKKKQETQKKLEELGGGRRTISTREAFADL